MRVVLTDALELGLELRLVIAVGDIEVVIGISTLFVHKRRHSSANGKQRRWSLRLLLLPPGAWACHDCSLAADAKNGNCKFKSNQPPTMITTSAG